VNGVKHTGGRPDLLGQIDQGDWPLEHVGHVFVERGSTSTNQVMSTGRGTAGGKGVGHLSIPSGNFDLVAHEEDRRRIKISTSLLRRLRDRPGAFVGHVARCPSL
jgi:hypothetical protein